VSKAVCWAAYLAVKMGMSSADYLAGSRAASKVVQ
jgi:hypothetical protein